LTLVAHGRARYLVTMRIPALGVLLALTGCGSQEGSTGSTAPARTASPATTTSLARPAEVALPAMANEALRVSDVGSGLGVAVRLIGARAVAGGRGDGEVA
jgi:hypothetical protein